MVPKLILIAAVVLAVYYGITAKPDYSNRVDRVALGNRIDKLIERVDNAQYKVSVAR